MCLGKSRSQGLDVLIAGEGAKIKRGLVDIIKAGSRQIPVHLVGLIGVGTPGAGERIEFDLFQVVFTVEHVIRPEDPRRDVLDIPGLLGGFVDAPECRSQRLHGEKILNGMVNPLLVLGNGAVQLMEDGLDIQRLLKSRPGKKRGKTLDTRQGMN